MVAWIPLVWAGLHVVRSATSYPGGWLSDRLGPRLAVASGGLLFAGRRRGAGRPAVAGAAVVVFLVLGAVAGLTESAERALVARLAPVRTGRGFGELPRADRCSRPCRPGVGFGALVSEASEGARALLGVRGGHGPRRGPLAGRHQAETAERRDDESVGGCDAPGVHPLGRDPAEAQVLIRVGDPARATYSELHEALRAGTPAADSVLRVLREKQPVRALAPTPGGAPR